MGNALGVRICGLGIDPWSQKMKSFFPSLIVYDVLTLLSYLLQDDQLTIISRNPFNKA